MNKKGNLRFVRVIYKRTVSLILALMMILSVAVAAISAADEPYDDEEVEETVKPTQPPTEAPRPDPQKLGYAAYASLLDRTVYDGELGAIYTKNATTFRLWTPAAKAVKVCIYKTGSDEEHGAQMLSANSMKYSKRYGVWYLTLKGDYKNLYYTYRVTVGDTTNEVVDPYAKAVGVNGNRGMIIDLKDTDPEEWDEDSYDRVDYGTEAVVWEVSVRDFSASETSGVSEKNRGKYLAFTELGTTLNSKGDIPTCVNYLRRLGVNYVQINPFYDFASIDESNTTEPQYNWGYDPKNYNVPEGSYSSDPYDGRVRIKECKEMIQALHDAGIGVIMDVVYNHTYYSEDSFLNQIAPAYYHRINEDGSWSNGSGCGNDVATERYMVSKMICDSVTYWAKEYHIDGFRFDLMGLMDVNTMNNIRTSLDKLDNGKRILMYGEAWNLSTSVADGVKLANQDNMNLLSKRIGAFNDTGRDAIKGSVFNLKDTGYVQTGKPKGGVRSTVSAEGGGWASVPNQCVNYSSCHDNLTLYDKLTGSVYGDEGYNRRREDLVDMNKVSAAIILMSRGMPFMLAGEEMGRTKMGDENSYISPIEINQIDWKWLEKYTSLVDYYRGLIKIRSTVGVLNDAKGDSTTLTYLDCEGKGAIAYSVSGYSKPTVVVAFNGGAEEKAKVSLPEGKWIVIADKDRAGLDSLGTAEGSYTLPETSAAVLIDAESFKSLGTEGDNALIYIRYIDKKDSSVILEQKVSGKIGESYDAETPDEVLFHYNILGDTSALSGEFEKGFSVVNVSCEEYEGGYSSVTFKYLDADGRQLSDTLVMTNRVGQQYYTPAVPGIIGYKLNLAELPENGAGLYTEEPIEVVYRYISEVDEPSSYEGDYSCRANIIYMSDSGEILEKKSYMGIDGDLVDVDKLNFGGYDLYAVSDNYAAFSAIETNIIVSYSKRNPPILLFAIIAGVIVLSLGAASFILSHRSKRRKIDAIEIEE